MSIDADDLIRRYGEAVSRGGAAVFVGAGVSASAGLPVWLELMQFVYDELQVDPTSIDPALAAQYFVDEERGRRDILDNQIAKSLQNVGEPGPLHGLIGELPVTEIWTTNYDELLEQAMPGVAVIGSDEDFSDSIEQRRQIIKMHGTLSGHKIHSQQTKDGPRFVIARDDFDDYPTRFVRMWRQLSASFLTKSFLFVGVSFADPNIEHLFRLANQTRPNIRSHYAIMKKPNPQPKIHQYKIRDLENRGINICEVEGFDEIPLILQRLVRRTLPLRVFVSGSYEGDEWNEACQALGVALAQSPVSIISGSNTPGRNVSYSLLETLEAEGRYSPDRVTHYFRKGNEDADSPTRRLGTVRYFGSTREALREELIRQARVVLLVAGGKGTAIEAQMADKAGIPVIPLAFTGGTALSYWEHQVGNLDLLTFGGKRVEEHRYRNLNHASNRSIAIQAAVALIKQATYTEE